MLEKIKNSSLIKSGFWYTVGTFMVKGINFLTIPIFTNILTVSEYGYVNNYFAVVALFALVIGLSLNGSVNNAYFEFRDEFKEFLSSVLTLSTLSFIGFLVVGNGIFIFTNSILGLNHFIFNLMLFHSYGNFLVNYLSTYFSIQVKYFRFLMVSLASTALNVGLSLAFMVLLFTNNQGLGRILGSAVGFISIGLIIYCWILFKGRTFFNKRYWKFALQLALPLVPHALSNLVLSQSDRIMINSIAGSYDAGIYSYIFNLGVVLSIVWQSTNRAWVPWFYRQMDESNHKHINKISKYYVAFFAALTLALILVMIDIARFLAPQEYHVGLPLIVPVMLGYFFQFLYSLPVNLEFYLKKTQYIAMGTVITAVVNIVLNALTIPFFSYYGAAYATVASYLLLFLIHNFTAKRLYGKQLFDMKFIGLIASGLALVSLLFTFLIDYLILRYLILIGLSIFIYYNAQKLKFR